MYCLIGGIASAFILYNEDIGENNFWKKLPEYKKECLTIILIPFLVIIFSPILILGAIALLLMIIGMIISIPFFIIMVIVHEYINGKELRK